MISPLVCSDCGRVLHASDLEFGQCQGCYQIEIAILKREDPEEYAKMIEDKP